MSAKRNKDTRASTGNHQDNKNNDHSVIAHLDPVEFLLNLKEALRDPDVAKSLNDALDFSKISKEIALEVSNQIKSLKENIEKKDIEINSLKEKCVELENRNEELEQYTRKNSLRFSGLEECDNENPTDTVLKVCNDLMKLETPVEVSDIDNAHRLGDASPRAFIVKFTSYRVRRRVFEAKRRLKSTNMARKSGTGGALWTTDSPADAATDEGTGRAVDEETDAKAAVDDDDASGQPNAPSPRKKLPPIFINEDLTRERNRLLFEARQLKRSGKLNDAWSFEGRIRIKTLRNEIVRIEKVTDLDIYK